MRIEPFALERYFAKHEFSARCLLSSSDCEPLPMRDLVQMAPKEMLNYWNNLKLGYTESQGHPRLLQEVAKTYHDIDDDDVLVVVPEEGIFIFMHALLEPGDHVVCTFPGYQSLYEIARAIGCSVSFWETKEDEGWLFDLDRLRALITPKTKLVVANFPHNPTGFIPPEEDYRELIELVSKKGIHLLSDEMYRHLEVDDGATLPAGCELYDQAVSLSGLSKSYGLPGLRLGWVATRDWKLLARMMKLKDYTTICASAPSEVLGIIAILNREVIISRQRYRVLRNLDVLDSFFEEFNELLRWNRPRGGSIGFARLMIPMGATEFCDRLVTDTGIMMAPSTVFQFGDDHVRIGFGRENLPEVINLFGEYLNQKFV